MKAIEYTVKVNKQDIDFLNKIIEAHEDVAIIRTVDKENSYVKMFTTNFYTKELEEILNRFDNLEIISKKEWEGNL